MKHMKSSHSYNGSLIFIILILVTLSLPVVTFGLSSGQAIDSWKGKALSSVAILKVETADQKMLTGMIFLALKDGLGVTSSELVKNAVRATVIFANGEEYMTTGIVDRDDNSGTALVKLRLFGKPLLTLRSTEPVPGENVFCAVNQDGDFGLVAGIVGGRGSTRTSSAVSAENSTSPALASSSEVQASGLSKEFLITAGLPEGNSGAPVFDMNGSIIGLLIWKASAAGQGNYTLVPAGFILALDYSLPTQPWASGQTATRKLESTATSSQQTEAESLEAIDTLLAEAAVTLYDLRALHDYMDARTAGQGFLSGVDKDLYASQQLTELILKKVAGLKIDDLVRRKAATAILEIGGKEYVAVDEFIRSVVIGQQSNSWNAQAQDMFKRSQASWQVVDSFITSRKDDLLELYNSSGTIREKLPKTVAFYFGVLKRPTKLKLGIVSLANDPFFIRALSKDSFADRLGFWWGDRIISADKQKFAPDQTLEDLKVIIMNNCGRQIEAVVERNNKLKTLKLKIPANIPPEYLMKD